MYNILKSAKSGHRFKIHDQIVANILHAIRAFIFGKFKINRLRVNIKIPPNGGSTSSSSPPLVTVELNRTMFCDQYVYKKKKTKGRLNILKRYCLWYFINIKIITFKKIFLSLAIKIIQISTFFFYLILTLDKLHNGYLDNSRDNINSIKRCYSDKIIQIISHNVVHSLKIFKRIVTLW